MEVKDEKYVLGKVSDDTGVSVEQLEQVMDSYFSKVADVLMEKRLLNGKHLSFSGITHPEFSMTNPDTSYELTKPANNVVEVKADRLSKMVKDADNFAEWSEETYKKFIELKTLSDRDLYGDKQ